MDKDNDIRTGMTWIKTMTSEKVRHLRTVTTLKPVKDLKMNGWLLCAGYFHPLAVVCLFVPLFSIVFSFPTVSVLLLVLILITKSHYKSFKYRKKERKIKERKKKEKKSSNIFTSLFHKLHKTESTFFLLNSLNFRSPPDACRRNEGGRCGGGGGALPGWEVCRLYLYKSRDAVFLLLSGSQLVKFGNPPPRSPP